jgi:hypothetical protein
MKTTILKTLEVRLTEEEVAASAQELAAALTKRADLEARKKSVTAAIKGEIETIDAQACLLTRRVATRRDWREVECTEEPDYRRGEVRVVRCDTLETVTVRTMTARERQMELDERAPAPTAKSARGKAPTLASVSEPTP